MLTAWADWSGQSSPQLWAAWASPDLDASARDASDSAQDRARNWLAWSPASAEAPSAWLAWSPEAQVDADAPSAWLAWSPEAVAADRADADAPAAWLAWSPSRVPSQAAWAAWAENQEE